MTEEEKLYGNNYQLRYEELKKKYDGLVLLNRATLEEYDEQEKMIELMAEYISGTDIDEDICKKVGQKQLCDEYGENSKCKECVIEYYKNKAKEMK